MTGVDKDLAILREVLTLAKHTPFGVPEFHLKSLCRLDFLCLHAPASLDRVEALLREQHAENARLREERDALAEAQQFPVETVMSWKRRAESAERMIRYARVLLDPERQDEPDEENALRAYEALSGIPLSVPADRALPERTLELVRDITERGVGPDTTPEEALKTIENLINKRHPREQP